MVGGRAAAGRLQAQRLRQGDPAVHGAAAAGLRAGGHKTRGEGENLAALTLAITWPQREANLLNNPQVAAQVHGHVRARVHASESVIPHVRARQPASVNARQLQMV